MDAQPAPSLPLARRLAASAAAVGGLSLLGKLLGFGREVALAAAFGASGESDAYFLALVLPGLVFAAVGDVLLTASVPVFAEHAARGGRGASYARLVWTAFHGTLLLAGLLAAAGLLLAGPLVAVAAPGLPPATRELAAHLTRVVIPATLFLAVTHWAMAILHAHQRFVAPALVPVPYNLVLIAATLLAGRYGDVTWVAWATVAAVASQVAVLLPGLRALLPRYAPVLDRRHPDLLRIARLALPVAAGLGVGSATLVVDRILASGLGEGAVSVVTYAARAALVPLGLLAMPVLTVLYPTLSARARGGDLPGTRAALRRGLAALALVMAPAAALVALFARDVVRFVYEHGAFGPGDTARTAPVLAVLALGLPFMAWRDLLVRACYALEEGALAVRTGAAAVAVHVASALLLMRPFGVPGLAGATSLAAAVQCALLLAALRRRLGGIGGRELAAEAWRIAAAAAALAAAAPPLGAAVERVGLADAVGDLVAGSTSSAGLADFAATGTRLGLAGAGALAVYALACRALRVRTFALVEELVRRRVGRARRMPAPPQRVGPGDR